MSGNDIAARARNIKASRLLYRVDVVARVESEDDITFWQKAIHEARPNVKVKYLPADTSGADIRQRGKTICLKYKDYLDKYLIICVDSDFDKFLHAGALTSSKYILQTHTYSWENHHCQILHLQRQWEKRAWKPFNFEIFLLALSHELYSPLLKLLAAKSIGLSSWSLSSLCSNILNVQVNQKGLLENDGKELLETISKRIRLWMDCQQEEIDNSEYQVMAERAFDIGMTADNAYLYMQGHCVYDLVLRIGNALCGNSHDFKYEVLDPAFYASGYNEIDLVKSDIAKIF